MIERIDVICTGGLYDDPEHGWMPRHGRQNLGRLWTTRTGHIGSMNDRINIRPCPQCGRRTLVAVTTAADSDNLDPQVLPTGYDGGVWQRILTWASRGYPDRRVVTVDISDRCYPW